MATVLGINAEQLERGSSLHSTHAHMCLYTQDGKTKRTAMSLPYFKFVLQFFICFSVDLNLHFDPFILTTLFNYL